MIKKMAFLLVLAILVDAFLLVFAWADRLFVEGLKPFSILFVVLVVLMAGIPLAAFAVRRRARYLGDMGWMDPAIAFLLGAFTLSIGAPWHAGCFPIQNVSYGKVKKQRREKDGRLRPAQ